MEWLTFYFNIDVSTSHVTQTYT